MVVLFVLALTFLVCLDDLDLIAMEYEKWNRSLFIDLSGSDFEFVGES